MVGQQKRDGILHIDIVESVFRVDYKGYLTEAKARHIMDEMYHYAHAQRLKAEPSLALFNISQLAGQSSGARSIIKSIKPHTFDKVAIAGGSTPIRLVAQYLVKAGNIDAVTKFTRTVHQADQWLLKSQKNTLKTGTLKRSHADFLIVPAILILVLGLTFGSWLQSMQQVQKDQQLAADTEVASIERNLDERLGLFVNILEGFKAFFESNDTVDREQFNNYIASLDLKQKYPGFSVFIYYEKVPAAQLQQFIVDARTDRSDQNDLKPNFSLTTNGQHEFYYPILYSAKGSSTRTLEGLDLGRDSTRLTLINQVARTGSLVASDTIDLNGGAANAPATSTRPGFYITLPVYQTAGNNSEDTLAGFVSATFEHKLILNELSANQEPAAISIYDTKDSTLLYRSDTAHILDSENIVHAAFYSLGGKHWRIELAVPPGYGITDQESNLPLVIASAGGFIAILLLVLYFSILRSRRRALRLAEDITKDLRRERNSAVALREKDEAILSSIGDAVFAIDPKGIITLFNKVAADLSGYNRSDAIGRHYMEVLPFLHQTTREVDDSFIIKALGGSVSSMKSHTVLIRTDGTEVAVADSAAPIRDDKNEIIGVIIVFRDVSKELELDRAKTEFVSLASHQLRTPLSAIKWYGELLLSGDAGKLTEVQHEYIQEIFEGSERMSGLVDSFLDVSRLEVGKLISQPEPTSLAALITDVTRELEMQISAKSITLKEKLATIPTVNADPKQLRMIVQNLLTNAVKYTDKHGAVTVVLRSASDDDRHASGLKTTKALWAMTVTDNGYGIPESQQSKIFTKLFRADNVRRLDVEGTGLGLYIVKQVVRKLGGKVWFDSVEGKGTTFTVVAPYDLKRKQ